MTEQELREKIANTYRVFDFWQDKKRRSVSELEAKFLELADKVLSLFEPVELEALGDEEIELTTDVWWGRYIKAKPCLDGINELSFFRALRSKISQATIKKNQNKGQLYRIKEKKRISALKRGGK